VVSSGGRADETRSRPKDCRPVYAYADGPSFERLREVTLASDEASLPRFSPDGKWIAYKTLPGGPGKKAAVSGFVTNISGAHVHVMRADLGCPDGSGRYCEGEDVDLTPGIELAGMDQAPTGGASFATFSPDSKQVFFTALVYTPHDGDMAATQQIFVTTLAARPDGSREYKQLTRPPPDDPHVSHRILHVSDDWSVASWSRFNSTGNSRRDLFGLEVAVCVGEYDPESMELTECEPVLTARPDIFMPLMRWYEAKGISDDGRLLYISGTPEVVTNPEVMVMRLSDRKITRLTKTGPCVWDEQLAFSKSPDGSTLLFSSSRDVDRPCRRWIDDLRSPSFPFLPPLEVYAVSIDGGDPVRVTYGFEEGVHMSTIGANPADPTDAILFEAYPGESGEIRRTRIRFPCEPTD